MLVVGGGLLLVCLCMYMLMLLDIEQERPYEDLRIIIKDNTPGEKLDLKFAPHIIAISNSIAYTYTSTQVKVLHPLPALKSFI